MYRFLINKIQAAIMVHDADTKIIACNSAAQELLGFTEDELLGKTAFDPIWKFLLSDNTTMPVDEYPVNQVMKTKSPLKDFYCGLYHFSRPELLHVSVSADPVFDDNGQIQQVVVTFVDATAYKQTEDTLKEQAKTLTDILENAADGICVCHNIPAEPYVRFTHWNPRMTDITGYTIDEINKLGWYQTVYPNPEIRKQAIEKMGRMREEEDLHSEEWAITAKDGKEKSLSISTSVVKKIGEEIHVLAIMKDISKRKRMEEALWNSQRKFQNIIEKSDDIIWTADLDINTTYVSPSVEKKLGFTPEERLRQRLEEQMPPSSYKDIMERLVQELEREHEEHVDPGRILRMEVEYYHKNGSILWFENVASGIRDKNGTLIGVQGISRDITEKKLAEMALRESEEKFKVLAEHSADLIYKLNIETGQCTYASPAVENLLGYTPQESLSFNAKDLLTADSYVKQQQRLLQSLENGYQDSGAMELEAIHKDGHAIPIEIKAGFLLDKQNKPAEILGIARDITERKQAQGALLAEKNRLQSALLEIKKLSGMLPICASCKKIRDDKGYWRQIETYITERSEAQFSHSICPKCAKELYPDIDMHDK